MLARACYKAAALRLIRRIDENRNGEEKADEITIFITSRIIERVRFEKNFKSR